MGTSTSNFLMSFSLLTPKFLSFHSHKRGLDFPLNSPKVFFKNVLRNLITGSLTIKPIKSLLVSINPIPVRLLWKTQSKFVFYFAWFPKMTALDQNPIPKCSYKKFGIDSDLWKSVFYRQSAWGLWQVLLARRSLLRDFCRNPSTNFWISAWPDCDRRFGDFGGAACSDSTPFSFLDWFSI